MRKQRSLVRGIGLLIALVGSSEADPGGTPIPGDVGTDVPIVHPRQVLERIDRGVGNRSIAFAATPAYGSNAERTLAPYLYVAGGDERVDRLPLKETSARIRVAGPIAHVEVRQVFENHGRAPIEAVYVFPASTRAAVHGMRMTIGSRVIEARIDERGRARAEYERARAEGRRASLLEQERPNVFTTSVANVMPRDRIEVALRYSELLVPEDATYELVYPAVVGPRYAGGADPERDGWIANPHLGEGQPEPYRFSVSAHIESALRIRAVESPSHRLTTTFASPTSAEVQLAGGGGGNRDFVLRWRLAGDAVEAGLMRFEDAGEKFFLLQVEPPARPQAASIPPREYVFVLDVSGSMAGFPLETTKALMRRLLPTLRPVDSFNVVLFAGSSTVLSRAGSVRASPENVADAIRRIDQLEGGGGTELMAGLRTAYGLPRRAAGTSMSVVLVTDGYVAVEGQAFQFVRQHLGEGNLFALGIGSSVNRALIEGLARAGDGEPFVVLDPRDAPGVADRFRRYIETPVLTDVSVRFEGLVARDVTSQGVPDVMAARPIVVLGRYDGPGAGAVVVSGRNGHGPWSRRIEFAAHEPSATHAPIRHLFARKWVEMLEDRLAVAPEDEGLRGAIRGLGLRYRLLTPFTSFVATDHAVVNRTGAVDSVRQPVPMPQGVSNQAVAGGASRPRGSRTSDLDSLMGSALGERNRPAGPARGALQAAPPAPRPQARTASAAPSPGRAPAVAPETPAASTPSEARPPAEVPASLPPESVRRVIRAHQTEVQRCYERGVPAQQRRGGRLTVTLVISPAGVVQSAIAAGLGNAQVEQCVVAAVRRWRFPAGAGPTRITYPLVLRAP